MTTANTEKSGGEKTGASEFDQLVSEISEVAKALPADDKTAAAKTDGEVDPENDEEEDEGAEDGEVTKSFKVKLADGSEVNAFDGAEIVKSINERAEKNEKALGDVFTIVKSLVDQVKTLSNAGRGRKTVVTIAEKPKPTEVNKALTEDGMDAGTFMAKALEAQSAGRIDGFELTRAENLIFSGKQPDEDFKRRVLGK